MKIGFDKKKSTEVLTALAQSTSDVSKKVIGGVKNGAEIAVEKTKANASAVIKKNRHNAYSRRLKKFNPLFPEQFTSSAFSLPNIIVIVDDAVRKDIDVCNGAIGWLGKENDVEILYLYDEAVPFSEIQFVPAATCDAVYYVDSFNRRSYIKSDCYFRKVQDERSAELEHIACCLGAKSCSVEIIEKQTSFHQKKRKHELSENVKGLKSNESSNQSSSDKNSAELHTRNYSKFQGNDVPQKPSLKWFAHESTILQLITARCSGDNSITEKDLDFYGSTFATMSQKAACAIDCALAATGNAAGNISMEAQATKEQESRLIFHVEF